MKITIGYTVVEVIERAASDGINGFKIRLESGQVGFISVETLIDSQKK
ncbi:MAG: hypothetical protein WD688_14615 [Candidatus Binatia bacterium]